MKLLSCFLTIVIAAWGTTGWSDEGDSVAAITAVNEKFVAAFNAGDSKTLSTVYTEDGQLLPPNAEVVSGHENISTFWQAVLDAGIASAKLDTVELEVMGDAAVEVGQYTLKVADGTTVDNGKFIVVWRKEAGEWKWHRDIWNSSKAP